MPLPAIEPPLVNSANPWATTIDDLQTLFDCKYTGAVTTRTSLLHGFEHDDSVHQYAFFDARDHGLKSGATDQAPKNVGSINTLGYSPLRLSTYLTMIPKIVQDSKSPLNIRTRKPFIVSVTGSAEAVAECYERIQAAQATLSNPFCMEVNLSCPNIPDKPPPAYSGPSLKEYLAKLSTRRPSDAESTCPIGIKTPPYTYHNQFQTLIDALLDACNPTCPIDFITATNTLGSSLILGNTKGLPAINSASGAGIGGLAGAPIHPLALGNVRTLRQMLDQHHQLKDIDIIGVGGVGDCDGFARMKAVGAKVVGIGTALGNEGIDVFEKIHLA